MKELSVDEQRMLDLLESQHSWPGRYTVKVIYRNHPTLGDAIVAALRAECGVQVPEGGVSTRASGAGRFVAMTLELDVGEARQVLAVYRVLGDMESVVSYF